MRRMVAWRSDLAGVGQWMRARAGSRSDRATERKAATRRCGFCVARFVLPEAALRRFPYLLRAPSRSLPLFRRVLRGWAQRKAAPPDAPRTEATDKGLPAPVRFEASQVEFVGSAERTRRGEPHHYQPGLLPR